MGDTGREVPGSIIKDTARNWDLSNWVAGFTDRVVKTRKRMGLGTASTSYS